MLLGLPCAAQLTQNGTGLFLHTDKHVYGNREKIWFTAYMLSLTKMDSAIDYHTLFVTLVNGFTKKPVISESFVINDHMSTGALSLPDTLPPGEYALIAYTNNLLLDNNEQPFQKWLSIRSFNRKPFRIYANRQSDSLCKPLTQTVFVDMNCDSARYHKRSKTVWKVKFSIEQNDTTKNRKNDTIKGYFSVACAYKKRIIDYPSDDIIRNLFLNARPVDSTVIFHTVSKSINPVSGVVIRRTKRLNKPVMMALVKPQTLIPFKTNKDGSFNLNSFALIAPRESEVFLTVVKKWTQDEYKIVYTNDIDSINYELAKIDYPYYFTANEQEIQDSSFLFSASPEIKILKEITIKGHQQDIDGEGNLLRTDSSCGSWVCQSGHWKCPHAFPQDPPTAGHIYYDSTSRAYIRFIGCASPAPNPDQQYSKKAKPVYPAPAFPAFDYSKDSISEPNYNTTLYWNYLIDATTGEAEFNFYTGDLPGEFILRLQGATTKGIISAEKSFWVE